MRTLSPLESIRYCILLALAKQPNNVPGIYRQILSDSRGSALISSSTIHKTLPALEKRKLVEKAVVNYPHHANQLNSKNKTETMYKLTLHAQHIHKSESIRLHDAYFLAKQRILF